MRGAGIVGTRTVMMRPGRPYEGFNGVSRTHSQCSRAATLRERNAILSEHSAGDDADWKALEGAQVASPPMTATDGFDSSNACGTQSVQNSHVSPSGQ